MNTTAVRFFVHRRIPAPFSFLQAKEHDYEELLLLSHDANHAKDMAQAELHRFEQSVIEERQQREKEVQVHTRTNDNTAELQRVILHFSIRRRRRWSKHASK